MRNLVLRFTTINLFWLLVCICDISQASQAPVEADTVIASTIYQIKHVLIKRFTPADLEKLIKDARIAGATGYELNNYSPEKMGWSLKDSKEREVQSVVIFFVGNHAREGTYYGPLVSSSKDAQVIHEWHQNVMSGEFKLIDAGKYDLSDNCVANMSLFTGATGLGRTIIKVSCQ